MPTSCYRKSSLARLAACILLIVGMLPGCSPPPDPPLRVGLLVFPSYELPFLARHLGYFEDSQIELVDYESPVEAMRDYRNGLIHAVALAIDYAYQLEQSEDGHRIFYVIDYSNGADAIIAQDGIGTFQELAGKRVGVEASGLGAFVLHRALEINNMSARDIIIRPVDIERQEDAFYARDIDAVVTYEPIIHRILEHGGNEIWNSRQIPGEIVDVLITRESTIENRRDQLVTLVNAWLQAIDYLDQSPDKAAQFMAVREGILPQDFLSTLQDITLMRRDDNIHLLTHPDSSLITTLDRLKAFRTSHNIDSTDITPEQLVSSAIITETHAN